MNKITLQLVLLIFLISCSQKETLNEQNLTPLQKLEAGNQRFSSEHPIHPNETLERLRELKNGQHPFATVITCSDSRVPVEIVFDQGFGDIFTIRTAGNIMGSIELGSIEYAVEHLDCKLIVVMGHKECGAIQAFIDSNGHYFHYDHIKKLIEYIENEKEEKELISHHELGLDKAINANIEHGVNLLKNSEPILKEYCEKKGLEIIGALYDIETGVVHFDN